MTRLRSSRCCEVLLSAAEARGRGEKAGVGIGVGVSVGVGVIPIVFFVSLLRYDLKEHTQEAKHCRRL